MQQPKLRRRTTLTYIGAGVVCALSLALTTEQIIQSVYDSANNALQVNVVAGSSGGYDTVDDEDTPLAQQTTLNFEGTSITCADDTDQTTCTITDDDIPESGDFGAAADLEADGSLSVDVVAPAEMADADHGDVSWSSGVATVEGGTADGLAADAIDATTDLDGALCGTNEILEDQGAAWACIATPAGASLPVADTTSVVEGSADPTKEIRFEVDGLTTSTTRVLTPQDRDYTLAGTTGDTAHEFGSDPADAGRIRLSNAESICWEASPAGTDECISLDSSENLVIPTNLYFDANGRIGRNSDNHTLYSSGNVQDYQVSTQVHARLDSAFGLTIQSDDQFGWSSSTTDATTAADTGLARNAAAEVKTTDGSTGQGRLQSNLRSYTQAATCTDSGDGSPGTLTLTPTSTSVRLTNSDADGCTVTLGETSVPDGLLTTVHIVSNAGGTVDFADTSGISELSAAFNMAIWDTLSLEYVSDRWVELGRSNN